MFNSGILDVAIGIVFIYLLVSLLVTAASELCAALLKYRGRILWRGLQHLLPVANGQSLAKRSSMSSAAALAGSRRASIFRRASISCPTNCAYLLNRFINIRSAGKAPEEKPKEGPAAGRAGEHLEAIEADPPEELNA